MSDDLPELHPIMCTEHGPSLAMFVCIHIAHGETKRIKIHDDCAWCDECDKLPNGSVTADDVKVMCADHFRELLKELEVIA